MPPISRRQFSTALGAAALAPASALAGTLARSGPTAARGQAPGFAIDFLASPGPFNSPDSGTAPLSAEMLRNAKESGITAINLSIGGFDVPSTFASMAYWERELDAHPDVLVRVRSLRDLRAARDAGKLGLIYGFQSTRMIGSDLDNLELFARFGVRIVQLTYNGRELIGDGCLEPGNAGLSRFGVAAVERLNALKTVVDLSHCGQRTTADGIRHSAVPVAISHSGCHALADRPRNKRDEELKAMADKGGVVGIYLMPFLTVGKAPTADDVVRHIEHALNVCGEDHVGIGSDLSISPHTITPEYRAKHVQFVTNRQRAGVAAPGEDPEIFFYVEDLNSPRRLQLVAERLSARRHPAARVEKIVGGNWARLLRDVWGEG